MTRFVTNWPPEIEQLLPRGMYKVNYANHLTLRSDLHSDDLPHSLNFDNGNIYKVKTLNGLLTSLYVQFPYRGGYVNLMGILPKSGGFLIYSVKLSKRGEITAKVLDEQTEESSEKNRDFVRAMFKQYGWSN